MQPIKNRRWQIVAAALVLVGFGFLAGALSMNLYHRRTSTNQMTRFDQALKQLHLNADQQAQVDAILADTRSQLREVRKEESPKFSDIRRKARERLQSVLTPEQWHQLQEKMRSGRNNQSSERTSLLPDDWRAQ